MATPGVSGEGCSESPGRFECILVDPIRNATLKITIPLEAGWVRTLGDMLAFDRSTELESPAAAEHGDRRQLLDRNRFADSLFLLTDEGSLGELIPDLRFRIAGRAWGVDQRLDGERVAGPIEVEIDRLHTGYTRNWPAYLSRRWRLRADAYSRFVESLVEEACGREAGAILRLDAPNRVHRFLAVIASRIHASPYET